MNSDLSKMKGKAMAYAYVIDEWRRLRWRRASLDLLINFIMAGLESAVNAVRMVEPEWQTGFDWLDEKTGADDALA